MGRISTIEAIDIHSVATSRNTLKMKLYIKARIASYLSEYQSGAVIGLYIIDIARSVRSDIQNIMLRMIPRYSSFR